MMSHYIFGLGAGFGILGLVIQVLFYALIIYAVFAVVRSVDKRQNALHRTDLPDSALRILNERYARDEISEEEYLRKKELITK